MARRPDWKESPRQIVRWHLIEFNDVTDISEDAEHDSEEPEPYLVGRHYSGTRTLADRHLARLESALHYLLGYLLEHFAIRDRRVTDSYPGLLRRESAADDLRTRRQ